MLRALCLKPRGDRRRRGKPGRFPGPKHSALLPDASPYDRQELFRQPGSSKALSRPCGDRVESSVPSALIDQIPLVIATSASLW